MLATRSQRATLYGDSWLDQGISSWTGAGTVATDSQGRFTFSPIDDSFRLGAVHPIGYGEVDQDALEQTGRIVIRRWGRIEGQVFRDGKPAVRMRVDLTDDVLQKPLFFINLEQSVVTDRNGHFTFERVKPGPKVALATTEGFVARAPFFHVQPGRTTQIQIGAER
jgi:hypothetical protein